MKIPRVITSILLVLIYLGIMNMLAGMYFADVNNVKSEYLLNKGRAQEALDYANQAISQNPMEPSYHRQRAKVRIVQAFGENETGLKDTYRDLALEDLNQAYQLNPINLATLRNNLPLYFYLISEDVNKDTTTVIDEEFAKVVKQYFSYIKDYTPNDVGVLVLVAKYEKRLWTDDYRETLGKIKLLRGDLLEWHPNLR